MSKKQKVIETLKEILEGNIEFKHLGLCRYIKTVCKIELEDIIDFSKYPKFSGNKIYPIPAPRGRRVKHVQSYAEARGRLYIGTPPAMLWYCGTNNKYIGAYGKKRLEFAKWCLKTLEKENGTESIYAKYSMRAGK